MSRLHISIDRLRIIDFCKKWGIARMSFFGSVVTDDFKPDSDVDVMVGFKPGSQWSLFDIVEMKLQLQQLFQREVDIVEEGSIKNPIKRKCIYENLEVVYESPR
ncbi:MAG: nucleotidyltransferase family protein [Candidatus Omnitrophica bacterium]|nr:nucleotidyltransferase family protein [Candidatus Omnitrophota bacterium]